MMKMDGCKVHEDGNGSLRSHERDIWKGPFKNMLLLAMKRIMFSLTTTRLLHLREVRSAHEVWLTMSDYKKPASLSNGGAGVGTTWTDTAPRRGMWDDHACAQRDEN